MKILIIGSGWLAIPLYKKWNTQGHQVWVTTRSEEKCHALQEDNISALVLDLEVTNSAGKIALNYDLICMAHTSKQLPFHQQLAERLASTPTHILFVSSTSVYADDREVLDEKSPTKQSPLWQIEQALLTHNKTTIVRCGGLIGNTRHPARWFAHRSELIDEGRVVNLVHLSDVIGIVDWAVQKELYGVYNAVSDTAMPKAEYYAHAVEKTTKKKPTIVRATELLPQRNIANDKIKQSGYTFVYPDVYRLLDEWE